MALYQVTLRPEEITFAVEENEMILDAAIRQGIPVAYSCRSGTCRTCLFRVVEGDVLQEDSGLCMISPQEIAENRRLLCMSRLRSDAVIEKWVRRRKAE